MEEIFENLLNIIYNKDLKELYKLFIFIPLIKNRTNLIQNFYQKIHLKGLNLIKNKKFNSKDIFEFIIVCGPYYNNPIYNKSDYRDPEIFKYIPITKRNKDDTEYLENIKIIKKNRLFDLFSECNDKVKEKFYRILLEQLKTLSDLKSIFDIFEIKSIERGFTVLINGRVNELIYTLLDEDKENDEILFDIFDNWLLICYKNNLDLNFNTSIIEFNYDFACSYYLHFLNTPKMKSIMDKVKSQLINFMIKQIQKQKLNPELIIFLLQNSPNEKFSSYILNQIDSLIMKKEDFYEKGENQKYLFFKLFFEKCSDLLKNNEIYQGYYLTETVMVMTSILYEIKNHDIIYQLINDLIESKGFYKKLEFLCNGFSN